MAGMVFLVTGFTHDGMSTRVSRGMEVTEALLRSAETCISICTSASGGLLALSLAPPSLTFSSPLRLSEPISRTLSGVWPSALAAVFLALEPPALRSPLRMLPLRCW